MTFESPGMLLGLLLVPLILLFGLWRTRPATVSVPSLRLWSKLKERNPPVRELRRPAFHLSLLLQALAAALLVIALAGPRTDAKRPLPRAIHVLLDDSASLAARDGQGRARWDLAKEAVRAVAAQAAGDDRIVLVTGHAGAGGPFPGRYDGPPSGVQAHLASSAPAGCGESAVVRAARLLAAECGRGDGRVLVVVSDRVAPDVAEAVKVAGGRFVTVGSPVRNAGILAFACEAAGGDRAEVFLRCAGPPGATVEVDVAVSGDGTAWRPLATVRVVLDRLGRGSRTWPLDAAPAGRVLRARVTVPDALKADDTAWLARPGAAKAVCFTARPGNLVRALQSVPGLDVAFHAAEPGRPAPVRPGARLAVYDGVVPERLPSDQWVVLANPPASVGPFKVGEEGSTAVAAWRTAPPLTDHVDLPSVAVRRARSCRVAPEPGGTLRILLGSRDRGPLLAWLDRPAGGIVYAGFDLTWRGDVGSSATSWALTPAFPIFWKNVVDVAFAGGASGGTWVSGRTCVPVRGGEVRIPHRSGVVSGEGVTGRAPVAAANLFDAEETACRSGGGIDAEAFRLPPAPEGVRIRSHVWICVVVAGVLLLSAWVLAARSA
jgi:hypothetical protein